MVTYRYVSSLIFILILSGCGGGKQTRSDQLHLVKKVDAYVIFPAALHYQHTGFDTYKQTALFQKAFQEVVTGRVIPFQEIETRSTVNYFDQSNLYLLLKNKKISYQDVLILQPEIVKYSDHTTMQITDKKGGQKTRAFQKDHYKITLRVYHPKTKKHLMSKTITFSITPFDIEYENPDTTYFITRKLQELALWSAQKLNQQFKRSPVKRLWQFNPARAITYSASGAGKPYNNKDQLYPLMGLLLNKITLREKMIYKKYGNGLVITGNYPPFKPNDLLPAIRGEEELKRGGKIIVIRGGKPVELTYTGTK